MNVRLHGFCNTRLEECVCLDNPPAFYLFGERVSTKREELVPPSCLNLAMGRGTCMTLSFSLVDFFARGKCPRFYTCQLSHQFAEVTDRLAARRAARGRIGRTDGRAQLR